MASNLQAVPRLWSKWINPSPAINSPVERRQALLLSALLLVFLAFGIPIAYIHPSWESRLFRDPSLALSTARVLVIAGLYLLSRTRFYRLAGALTVALTSVIIITGVILNGTSEADSFLILLLLPIVLSSLLFPLRTMLVVALANSAGMLLVPMFRPDIISFGLTGQVIGVVLIVSALLALAMRERLVIERDRQGAIQESAQQLQATFEQAAVGIAHNALDGRYLRVNRRFCQIVGYTEEELLQKNFQALTYADDLAVSVEQASRLLAGEVAPYMIEKRYVRKDGPVVWVNLAVSLVRDVNASPKYYLAVIDDISERKVAEAARRESEERFSGIFYASPVATVIVRHHDGQITEANPAFLSLTGYERHELLGHSGVNLHFYDAETLNRLAEELTKNGVVHNVELALHTKSGVVRWVVASTEPISLNGEACRLTTMYDITDRKAAETALRESEERFSKIFHNSPSGTAITRQSDDHFIEANSAFLNMVGYARGELIGHSRVELNIYDAEARKHVLEQLKQEGALLAVEVPLRTKSGAVRWILGSTEVITLNGEACILSTGYDITERKEAEMALRESEERFSKVFYSSPIGITITRQSDGRFLEANQAYLDLVGYQRRDLLGHSVVELQIANPENRTPIVQEIGSTGTIYGVETTVRTRSGDERWILGTGDLITLNGERCILGLAQDITERKEAEMALRESQERFAKVFQSNPVGIIISRMSDLKFIEVNPVCQEMLGYQREELIGHTSLELELIDPNSRQAMLEAFQREGMLRNVEIRLRRKSGDMLWVLVCLENISLNGAPCALNIFIDITARKEAEEEVHRLNAELEQRVVERTAQLTSANKELEAFSYSVSHDLRAPLRAIDGFSQALVEDYSSKLDGEAQHYLTRIRAGSQRMGALIDDMLKLSRVTRAEMQRETVDMSALAREIAADLHEGQPERRVEFVIEDGLVVQADRRLLQLALVNLLGNAWKFTGKQASARIAFRSEEQDGQRVFVVEDNGVGFDMAYADKLFGAFQRLHLASEFDGTGIGLATVQRIIHRHEGRIWANSAVGQGAAFYFIL